MMYRQTFTVCGMGFFPVDMLRYDYCYPFSSDDATHISTPGHDSEPREVTLSRIIEDKDCIPTEGKWRSFDWVVLDGRTFTNEL